MTVNCCPAFLQPLYISANSLKGDFDRAEEHELLNTIECFNEFNQFEDFKKGSCLTKNDFEDFVVNVVNRLKKMYEDFADLFNYKARNGEEYNLIEDEVDIVAEQYEEYKQKTTSRERG